MEEGIDMSCVWEFTPTVRLCRQHELISREPLCLTLKRNHPGIAINERGQITVRVGNEAVPVQDFFVKLEPNDRLKLCNKSCWAHFDLENVSAEVGRCRKFCAMSTQTHQLPNGITMLRMPPSGDLNLRHAKLKGSVGPVTLVAEIYREADPMPVMRVAMELILLSKNRKRDDLEWSYFGISPHQGLAHQNNIVEVQAHLPPTPASRVEVYFASWPSLAWTAKAQVLKAWEDGIFIRTPAWMPSAALVYLRVAEISKLPASGDILQAYYEFVEQKEPSVPTSLMVPAQEPPDFDLETSSVRAPSFLHYNMRDDDELTVESLEELAGREDYERQGFTPLMIAAYVGSGALIEALLDRGHFDNLHATDSHGRGALWWGLRGSVWDGEPNRIIFREDILASLQLLLMSCEQAEAMQGLESILFMDRVPSSDKPRKTTQPFHAAAAVNKGQPQSRVDLPVPEVVQKASISDDLSRRLERFDIASLHPKDRSESGWPSPLLEKEIVRLGEHPTVATVKEGSVPINASTSRHGSSLPFCRENPLKPLEDRDGRAQERQKPAKATHSYGALPPGLKFSLRSHHGTYLRISPNNAVDAAPHCDEWEQFVSERDSSSSSSNAFAVRSCHGTYLRFHASVAFVDAAPHLAAWELFQITTHENGKVSLRSYSLGTYLRINKDGSVSTARSCDTEWEQFDMITHQ